MRRTSICRGPAPGCDAGSTPRALATLALLTAVLCGPSSLRAQEVRRGEVVEARAGTVRVELTPEGDGAPATGDSVAVFDPTVPGLDPVPVQGSWVVARAEGGTVWIEAAGSAASVQPGYLVRIVLSGPRPDPPSDPGRPSDPGGELTLDGVLERYYDAVGGRDAWGAVRSVRVRGSVEREGVPPLSFEQVVARPYRLWGRAWGEGYTRTRGLDGETAWIRSQRADESPPSVRIVDREGELLLARFEADLDGPLMGHDDAEVELELLGTERVDGVEAYVIAVSPEAGLDLRVLLDAERFLPRMLVIPNPEDPEDERDRWVQIYDDYRSVGGLLVPYLREVVSPDSVKYVLERVEFDVPLDASLFEPPDDGRGAPEVPRPDRR